ncbi:pheST operon leader peptide PheM [Xenorhabdus sp. Sc-CR9]
MQLAFFRFFFYFSA